jgi:ADP-ribose pyrophosphatase YjhB (NUDIX family)
VKDSHCSFCGHPFPETAAWPRTCAACGRTAYRNPLPVAIALLPVPTPDGTGPGATSLVVIRRAINPQHGRLALPGGFVDHGETWQQAVTRELTEETGITADAADVRLADVLTDVEGYLLVFGLLPPRPGDRLPPSRPTDETYGRQLLPAPEELGFPLHTEAARRYFAGRYDTSPRTRTR